VQKNQKFSANFKTSKVNLMLEIMLFLFKQRAFVFALMQRWACLKEHVSEVIDFVFCALCMVCPDSAVSWNRRDCNRQSMKRVQNTWSFGIGLCLNTRTQMQFSKQPFSWFWS